MQKVDENTPGAKKREYELKDGTKGHKWELQFKNITGYVNFIDFKDSPFGEQFILKITDGEEAVQLQMPTDSKYFSSFAQRFKNINLSLPVVINAYDFENDSGKQLKGISLVQEGKKIQSYFWDDIAKAPVNGLPQPDNRGEGYDSDDWKYYFSKVKKFLKQHLLEELNSIAGNQSENHGTGAQEENNPLVEHSEQEPEVSDDDDLPF